jgi:hypothetical protein
MVLYRAHIVVVMVVVVMVVVAYCSVTVLPQVTVAYFKLFLIFVAK